jgi:GTP-binding protein
VDKIFEQINYVYEKCHMRISTGVLNDALADAVQKVQPPSDKGRRLKLYYITQSATNPPTFVVFCNRAELFHFSYRRYIENQIRQVFGIDCTPVKFIVRERDSMDVK